MRLPKTRPSRCTSGETLLLLWESCVHLASAAPEVVESIQSGLCDREVRGHPSSRSEAHLILFPSPWPGKIHKSTIYLKTQKSTSEKEGSPVMRLWITSLICVTFTICNLYSIDKIVHIICSTFLCRRITEVHFFSIRPSNFLSMFSDCNKTMHEE